MKRLALLAFGAALIASGCGQKDKPVVGADPPATCAAVQNAAEINTILQNAEQNPGSLSGSATRLASISADTAGAAAREQRPQDKIRCYGLSLRAAGALLRVAGSEATALDAASAAAIDGQTACEAITSTLDTGVAMDCARIKAWRFTLATLRAVQEIEGKVPAGGALTPEAWPAIKAQMVRVGENVSTDWSKTDNAQEARNHRTRTACRYYLQSTRLRGAFGLLSPVMNDYNATNEPIIDALVKATPVSPAEAGCAANDAEPTCLEKRRLSFIEGCRALANGG